MPSRWLSLLGHVGLASSWLPPAMTRFRPSRINHHLDVLTGCLRRQHASCLHKGKSMCSQGGLDRCRRLSVIRRGSCTNTVAPSIDAGHRSRYGYLLLTAPMRNAAARTFCIKQDFSVFGFSWEGLGHLLHYIDFRESSHSVLVNQSTKRLVTRC